MTRAARRLVAQGAMLVIAGLVVIAPGAAAAPPTPTDVVREAADGVIAVLRDATLRAPGRAAERRAALERAVAPAFDFDEMARSALGRHWQARTTAERRQFTTLFRELLEHAYARTFEAYNGERVRYDGETHDGPYATVRTAIVTPHDTDIGVVYRLHAEPVGWRIYDVRIEGVSLIENYRAQFNTVIDESSYRALLERLEARVTGRTESAK